MANASAISDKVKTLQKSLGVKADGIMGPNTIRALQKFVGVPQDGVIGPKTRAAAAAKGITLPTMTQVKVANQVVKKAGVTATAPAPVVAKPTPAVMAALTAPPTNVLPPVAPSNTAVSALVSSIPADARTAAASSLAQLAATPGVSMSDVDRLVAALSTTMAPQLSSILEALKLKQASMQATGESNELLAEQTKQAAEASVVNANLKNWELNAEQWANNASAQAQILGAIAELAKRVTVSNAVNKRFYQAYGYTV